MKGRRGYAGGAGVPFLLRQRLDDLADTLANLQKNVGDWLKDRGDAVDGPALPPFSVRHTLRFLLMSGQRKRALCSATSGFESSRNVARLGRAACLAALLRQVSLGVKVASDLEVAVFLVLFFVFLVCWVFGFVVFHVAGGLIHALLIVAAISLIWHFVSGRTPA
jgi:Family of unknown function (DUF5670)